MTIQLKLVRCKSKVNYTLAAKEVLDYPDPDKPFKKPDFDVNFSLTEDNLRSSQVLRQATFYLQLIF